MIRQLAACLLMSWGALIVVDGDTVKLDGRNYRLIGFDAPETFHAKCMGEFDLGMKAAHRLQELIDEGAELERLGRDCRYGRECAVLRLHGVNVAATMIAEGLARPYVCTVSGHCPRRESWCN